MSKLFFSMAIAIIAFFSYAPQVNAQISIIRDQETENFLKDVTKPILSAAGLDSGSVDVIIVNDKSINAFVTGGQKIFIHTGLITECPDVSCLVGVIAHEAGHIKGGHLIRKGEAYSNANISAIAGYVLGVGSVLAGAPAEAGMALSSAGQNVGIRNALTVSRDYENSADAVALDVMKKIDISPKGLVSILEILKQKQNISGDIYDKYLLTHPVSQERISYIENFIRENPETIKPLPRDLQNRFEMVKAKIYGFLHPASVVKGLYGNKTGKDAIYAKSISLHKQAKFTESEGLLRMLISREPDNPYFKELSAQFLFERGELKKSADKYKEVLSMIGNSNLVRLKLADSLIGIGKRMELDQAVGQLKAILATDPHNAHAVNKLGIVYGKQGKIEESYLYLADSAVIAKNAEDAKFYLAKAEQLVDKSSENYSRLVSLKEDFRKLKSEK